MMANARLSFGTVGALSGVHAGTHADPPFARQRGVAIITALVVVAAATVAISGMLWHQSVAFRKADNHAAASQARWLARGAVDWVRVVLRDDARLSNVDHLGESWAVPLDETRISDGAVAQGSDNAGDSAWVSGHILDLQARYNLVNLVGGQSLPAAPGGDPGAASAAAQAVSPGANRIGTGMSTEDAAPVDSAPAVPPRIADPPEADGSTPGSSSGGTAGSGSGQPNPVERAVLARLLVLLGQPQEQAEQHAAAIALRMSQSPRPQRLDDLAALVTPATLAALRPFVVILSRATPVNLNTAAPEILAARFENLPLDRARALVESRRRAHFNQISDAFGRLPDVQLAAPTGAISASTDFFEVTGLVRQRRVELTPRVILERNASGATRIVEFDYY